MKNIELTVILEIVNAADEALNSAELYRAVKEKMQADAPGHRTFMRRLASLVAAGAIVRAGKARAVKYLRTADTPVPAAIVEPTLSIPIAAESKMVREYVRRPQCDRRPVGYDRDFLEVYIPNDNAYLSDEVRQHLFNIGEISDSSLPEGSTYQPETVNRLMVDLSWASSRLEGNTYSRLDTRDLLEDGVQADGKDPVEATMILNHKYAIEMLLETPADIDFNMYTFLTLHSILVDDLMGDPEDCGRLRQKIVEIGGSVYRPLGFPQQVEECFRLFLNKTKGIEDPFEQAFFTMVHLPYLQPFTDVNKRTARLGANIPLIKNRLCPLSFIDVPEKDYTEGNLGVYELTQTSLLRDVFVWAYEQSCRQYNLIKDHTTNPDLFRLKHKRLLYQVTGQIVKGQLKATAARIAELAQGRVADGDAERFISLVNKELQILHHGNLGRYRISLDEFKAWQQGQSDLGSRHFPDPDPPDTGIFVV